MIANTPVENRGENKRQKNTFMIFIIAILTILLVQAAITIALPGTSIISEIRMLNINHTQPNVTSIYPINNTLNNTHNLITFGFNVTDELAIDNCSLIINNTLNATNTTITRNQTNTITTRLDDGPYDWNINCTEPNGLQGTSEIRNLTIDTSNITIGIGVSINITLNNTVITSPNITLSFNVTSTTQISSCTLIHNLTGAWQSNLTIYPQTINFTATFNLTQLPDLTDITWNIECQDLLGNTNESANNITTYIIYPIDPPTDIISFINNTNETDPTYKRNLTINWTPVDGVTHYKIEASTNLSRFDSILNTTNTTFIDFNASDYKQRFYRIVAVKHKLEVVSTIIIGKQDYKLERIIGNRAVNRITIPFNDSRYKHAGDILNNIPEVTEVRMWNASSQKAIVCNRLTCPEPIDRTDTSYNFTINSSYFIEITISQNPNNASTVNFTTTGIVETPAPIQLIKKPLGTSKNWPTLPANTTITTASELMASINNAGQGTVGSIYFWNSTQQKQYYYLSFRGGWGTNFPIDTETGYQVYITSNTTWTPEWDR